MHKKKFTNFYFKRERLRRSKDGKGNWRRQWDIEKQGTCPDDVNHQ